MISDIVFIMVWASVLHFSSLDPESHIIKQPYKHMQEVAESVKQDFGSIDILVHSLANGPEVNM